MIGYPYYAFYKHEIECSAIIYELPVTHKS